MGRKNTPEDVFLWIDTHDNDISVCWEWQGYLGGRDGRGYINIDGKKQLAHRVMYQLFNGPIPEGKVVRHKCNNEKCCNPTHLVVGTKSQNELDKYKSDRAGYTQDMLKEMRRAFSLNMTDVAVKRHIDEKFGTNVSVSGIGAVRRGERRAKELTHDRNSDRRRKT